MRKLMISLLLILPAVAMAAEYWHPEAQAVTATAPYPTEVGVCYWHSGTSVGPTFGNWACDFYEAGGARDPVTVYFDQPSPTKVFGKWAYALDLNGAWVPMQRAGNE